MVLKIGIITIIDNNNYGNRLQNYATQEIIKKINLNVITIKNKRWTNNNHSVIDRIKHFIIKYKEIKNINIERKVLFNNYNKNIMFSKEKININNYCNKLEKYNYLIVGSDQVWNPNGKGYRDFTNIQLLYGLDRNKKISFAASFRCK